MNILGVNDAATIIEHATVQRHAEHRERPLPDCYWNTIGHVVLEVVIPVDLGELDQPVVVDASAAAVIAGMVVPAALEEVGMFHHHAVADVLNRAVIPPFMDPQKRDLLNSSFSSCP